MSAGGGSGELEQRYRRLLRWYPAEHRARHDEEMLGVLMDNSESGQRRPGTAESANLIWGGLRIRLRAATIGSADQWRDALARAGVVLPVGLLAAWVAASAVGLYNSQAGQPVYLHLFFLKQALEFRLPLLGLVIAVLAGWRRITLAACAVLAVLALKASYFIVFPLQPPEGVDPAAALTLTVLVVVALATVLAAGPRPPRALLTGRQYALAAAVPAAAAAVAALANHEVSVTETYVTGVHPQAWIAPAIIVAAALVMLRRSRPARYLLAVLALPAYYFLLLLTPTAFLGELTLGWRTSAVLMMTVPVSLMMAAGIALVARQRPRRRTRAGRV